LISLVQQAQIVSLSFSDTETGTRQCKSNGCFS